MPFIPLKPVLTQTNQSPQTVSNGRSRNPTKTSRTSKSSRNSDSILIFDRLSQA